MTRLSLSLALLVAACSSSGAASGGRDSAADQPANESPEPVEVGFDIEPLAGAQLRVTVDGDVVGYFGWVEQSSEPVGDSFVGARVGACAAPDSRGELGAFGITAGGAELLNPNFEADSDSPLEPRWTYPAPGGCAVGWQVMPIRSRRDPTTLVWRHFVEIDEELTWPLGSPTDPQELG